MNLWIFDIHKIHVSGITDPWTVNDKLVNQKKENLEMVIARNKLQHLFVALDYTWS